MSMPTSTTVVATMTSISRSAKRRMTSSRSRAGMRPWRSASRVRALPRDRRALPPPEAMLLVDDRQAEPLERDGLLDERVRADDHLELARRERVDDRASSRAGHARGEEGGPGGRRAARRFAPGGPCSRGPPRAFEELRERAVVLLREQLRGRHERGLGARSDGDARGERRDDRL